MECNATIRNKDRYVPYCNVTSIFEPEQYLSALEIYCFRVGLCQLRLGVLPINNNLRRYSACAIQRNCVFCVNAIENEEHLLFACPLYNDIREKQLNDTSQNAVTASLKNVLSWKSKTNMFRLAKFVFSAIRRRKEFTGQTSFTIQHCKQQTGFTVSFTCSYFFFFSFLFVLILNFI